MTTECEPQAGKVFLVGAGPGDPGLITLRGVECLHQADVVLYDYLVNPRILAHAPSRAEQICLGRHGRSRIWDQQEINKRMIELAEEGKTVVRLKGGDPAVFARGADEAEALISRRIPFEVVPGVTAALAAASYAGIPITHREHASAVALVTGQEDAEKKGASLDYEALAKFPGTLVVYMGVTTARRWATALIAAGLADDTPAAIVRRCSFSDQRVIRATLGEVADKLSPENGIRPPVIVIVGKVASLAPTVAWCQSRPLFGNRIMVSRPRHQAGQLTQLLEQRGADVVLQPAIEISAPADWSPVDHALRHLDQYDWLVFSSSNGVRFFLERLESTGGDLRDLAGLKLATIGPGTSRELARYHLRSDLQPDEFRAEALAAALAPQAAGKRFLLARASRGREVLGDELSSAGGQVDQVVVYHSGDVTTADQENANLLADGRIDWITVTSSAIANSLAAMFGEDLKKSQLASISPVTSATLRNLGFEPTVEAQIYTMQGLVKAITNQR